MRNFKINLFCVAASAVLFCSQDYNPFTDPSNANVYITSWTFSDRDSVSLFETGICRMVAAAREMIDSFGFSVPKNRYWQDTVVKMSPTGDAQDNDPYLFEVSFYDTGLQALTLTTFRSNGQVLKEELSVRVYNPLKQKDVIGYFGDTIDFFTTAVPDEKKGVLYHWSLGGNWNGASVTNLLSSFIPLFSPQFGTGSLWVSDLSGDNGSPPVDFTYSLNDTARPIIRCINDGLKDRTILSADTLFAFKAFIADAGSADVESCSVNREPFDFVNRSSGVYTKLFENLPDSSPLTVEVFAIDNLQFKNTACDTFIIIYDSSATKSASVSVTFDRPAEDMAKTSQRSYRIHGTAQSNTGDTMHLSCRSNERTDTVVQTIIGAGEWSWLVSLDSLTTVTVSAHSLEGRLLASAQRVIVFDSNAVDSIKPMIWEVSTDGQLLGSQFYTHKSSLLLKIVAFDDGSGMAHLLINQDPLPVDSTSYVWWWNTGNLAHGQEGNAVRVVAIDKRNNREERTVVIYKNSQPTLINDIDLPTQCCAESTYTRSLFWKDADNDPVQLTTIKFPQGMTVSQEGEIKWKPLLPTGAEQKDTLILELFDGYEKTRYRWFFFRKRCSQAAVSIAFTTTEKDFPAILQAGVERLNVRLSIDSSGVTFLPKYRAVFLDNGKTILNNDTSGTLLWTPSLADTGYRRLMVTVGDGVRGFDTLFPALWVVPKNQYPCSLSVVFSGETTPIGLLDLFTHPEPETLYFTVHDRDHPLTEICTVTVSLGTVRSVQVLKQNTFFVAIAPDSSRLIEALAVKVRDKTGTSDSLQFIIQYGSSTVNIPPIVSGDPDFPIYCCADSSYEFRITVFDPEGDSVEVVQVYAPPGMNIAKNGVIRWTPLMTGLGDDTVVIRLFDGHDSSDTYQWAVTALDCDNMPPAVRFKTGVGDFPTLMQAEIDSISLQLEIVEGTGVRPFVFQAHVENDPKILDDSIGRLFWIPSSADTGVCTMEISVRDRYNTVDILSPHITVVPRNCSPCSLSYTYSGARLSSGELYLFSRTEPESAHFIISDADHPATEQYNVTISRRRSSPTTLALTGEERSFPVRLNSTSHSMGPRDTIVVSVHDLTGTSDTVRLFIRYPIDDPDSIAEMAFWLNASSGVTTQFSNNVSSWSYGSSGSGWPPWGGGGSGGVRLTQSDFSRMPNLVEDAVNGEPAILFDEMTDNGDDGLFSSSSDWADTPFTVFIVFSPRSLDSYDRSALFTTNTIYGFGLGFTCDGTLGIFNDINGRCCNSQDCPGSDLHVSARSWYVATYQSSLGITVGGKIQVQAWLNGKAASQILELSTRSNSGMAIGTSSSATYNGSFDGWIASIIFYQRALSTDERFLVERYLGSVYGITME